MHIYIVYSSVSYKYNLPTNQIDIAIDHRPAYIFVVFPHPTVKTMDILILKITILKWMPY